MAKKKTAGGTPATVALTAAGIAHTVHAYPHDPRSTSYGLEAAEALGLDPARVHKTLMASVDGALTVAIVPVSGQLDLKALARAVGGSKARDGRSRRVAQRVTGYVVGGISPIGQRRAHPTVLDERALAWPTIFVSGGKRGLDLELAPADLVRITDAVTAPIGRRRLVLRGDPEDGVADPVVGPRRRGRRPRAARRCPGPRRRPRTAAPASRRPRRS